MIQIQKLRKVYTSKVAVNDVSFDVDKGVIFGLLGPNGAGKTTTIRMILNIILPDSGAVLFDGMPFSEDTKNRIGYLPEERGLYKKNKVGDTIEYFGSLKNMNHSDIKKQTKYWLERFDIKDRVTGKVEELSKGNQQKIQFIIAVLHNPDLLILDEPFSGFDPVNQDLLKDVLIELKKSGKTIIFSTHQMEQVEKLCDRICLINDGEVVLSGNLNDVKKQHGNNSINLSFSGDASFIKNYPNIKRINAFENYAEMIVTDKFSVKDFIDEANKKLEIKSFQIAEPSLHSIFVEKVGRAKSEEAR
jgi:ABC-2 type transport system ATP-binding protein